MCFWGFINRLAKAFSAWVSKEIQTAAGFIAALCFFNLTVIEKIWISGASYWVLIRNTIVMGLQIFALVTVLVILLNRLPWYLGRFLKSSMLVGSLIMLLLNQFALLQFGEFLTIGMAEALLATTGLEAREFLMSYLTMHIVIGLSLCAILVISGGTTTEDS